ncbi:proline racemase family protein [Shewanella pneumatophori]|uniref:trans-L-3-hydroxyproline dehydratase n=1 Tax=Shewanella pneumatophori TaxID=314092 RepID=A0A9X2CJE6_9GAMM|nr:proline racemase family protein [Shewanella pneumatophori]MCL1140660.1 proline racemase family protein [Shewanella pneumatophori]
MTSITIKSQLSVDFKEFVTLDAHTEGEPLRIIMSGYPEIKGDTILEKRQYVQTHLDTYRKLLMHEPRGHADMYGVLITDAVTEGADFGVLFLHNEGYSSMCGHGILALVKVMCETGTIKLTAENESNARVIKIDSPAGLITAKAFRDKQEKVHASFINVDSWADAINCQVDVEGFGMVDYDIGFGGAYYAYVDADSLGISCAPSNAAQLIDLGRRIKLAVMANHPLIHPVETDLSFLYGTIFTSKKVTNPEAHSRHVCIFADGEVDRSPTGTGVSGRIALLHAKGEVELNNPIMIESIVDGRMIVSATAQSQFNGKSAVLPEVSGRAFITGKHEFYLDPDDIFQDGFILR